MKGFDTIKTLVLVILFSIVAFICLFFAARKANGDFDYKMVLVATQELPKNTEITKENINSYFKSVKANVEMITEYNLSDASVLVGTYTNTVIHENEPIKTECFQRKKDILDSYQSPCEASVSSSTLGDVVSGTIRAGDWVEIYVLDEYSGEATLAYEKPLYITSTFNNNGERILPGDLTSVSSSFNFYIERDAADELYHTIGKKKVILTKVTGK